MLGHNRNSTPKNAHPKTLYTQKCNAVLSEISNVKDLALSKTTDFYTSNFTHLDKSKNIYSTVLQNLRVQAKYTAHSREQGQSKGI